MFREHMIMLLNMGGGGGYALQLHDMYMNCVNCMYDPAGQILYNYIRVQEAMYPSKCVCICQAEISATQFCGAHERVFAFHTWPHLQVLAHTKMYPKPIRPQRAVLTFIIGVCFLRCVKGFFSQVCESTGVTVSVCKCMCMSTATHVGSHWSTCSGHYRDQLSSVDQQRMCTAEEVIIYLLTCHTST